jgi:hypothetical protein
MSNHLEGAAMSDEKQPEPVEPDEGGATEVGDDEIEPEAEIDGPTQTQSGEPL